MQRKVVMWKYKETPPALIFAVFVLLFCTNGTLAQTSDEGNKISSLANTLLSAKTESEQNALLAAAEPGLITVELVQELKKQYETFNKSRELSKALVALKLIRTIAEKIGDEKNAAFAIVNIGVNYYTRGEFQQASELFEHYLSLDPSKRDPGMTARALNIAGMIKRTYGDNPGALDYVQRSQRLAEEVGDKKMLGSAFNNLGVIYRDYGEYARALEYFEKSLALGEALGDKTLISLEG